MTTWVIIPVKPLRLAKSRLAEILTPEDRQHVAEAMFRHVLQTIREAKEVTGTLVISRDNQALSLARDYGAKTIQESGAPELNTALMRATSVVGSWGCDSVLVLPADLPLIEAEDITKIIEMGRKPHPNIVLATDRNKDGTNALYIQPPGLITYAYGENSFNRHAVLARDAGAEVSVYQSERVLQDIDLPEDIENYLRITQRNHQQTELMDVLEKIRSREV